MRLSAMCLHAATGTAFVLALLGCGLMRSPAPTPQLAPPTLAAAPAGADATLTATATFAVPTLTPARVPTATSTRMPAPTPTATAIPAELAGVDATWNRYTNRRLGFSLKVPRQAVSYYGGCAYSDQRGDHSWRPQEQSVAVNAFEDADSVYITFEHGYKLMGETKEGGRSYFSGCERQATTLEELRQARRTWQIIARRAQSDADVDAFLKERFGPGCSVGEKRPTAQKGVQEIRIKGDGKDLATTQCPVNYAVVIRYAPQKGRLYAWDLGQACTFYTAGSQTCYDGEMTASFRVE